MLRALFSKTSSNGNSPGIVETIEWIETLDEISTSKKDRTKFHLQTGAVEPRAVIAEYYGILEAIDKTKEVSASCHVGATARSLALDDARSGNLSAVEASRIFVAADAAWQNSPPLWLATKFYDVVNEITKSCSRLSEKWRHDRSIEVYARASRTVGNEPSTGKLEL